jgi:hypothetical protein
VPEYLFFASTQHDLNQLVTRLPQSLIMTGPAGIGLSGALSYIATGKRTTPHIVLPEKDEKVDLDKGTISVSSIRRLYELTRTIASGPRLIVIDYAERMAPQAQNAFLKLLEEPTAQTHFILLTHDPAVLLPTVHSRAQRLDLQPISQADSEKLLDTLGVKDARRRAQLLFIASGLPAELTRLAGDEKYFEERAGIIRDAREFLGGSLYTRLRLAASYKDDRTKALLLLEDAMKLIRQNVAAGKTELLPKLDELLTAHERLVANGNVRLQLGAAMV